MLTTQATAKGLTTAWQAELHEQQNGKAKVYVAIPDDPTAPEGLTIEGFVKIVKIGNQ